MSAKPCWLLLLPLLFFSQAARAEDAKEPEPYRKLVRLAHQDHNVVRSGPGEGYTLIGVYKKGEVFPVIAKSGGWYNVQVDDSQTGWVHVSLCEELDDMSVLEFRPNPKLYSRVGSFLLTGTVSGYSFDQKSNSLALGGRLGYYVLDFIELEGSATWTEVVRPAEIVESLFDLRLEEERFDMLFYALNLTVEILPGRQMVPFVTGGAGSSILEGKSETSWNLGAGTRLYVGKRSAIRWEVRNHHFTSGTRESRRDNNNFEFIIGTSFLL